MMNCCPKNSPPKFQLQIRSKSARIKTRVDDKKSVNLAIVLLNFYRAELLRIWSWNFGGEFLGPQIIIFSLRVWNFLTFARPILLEVDEENVMIHVEFPAFLDDLLEWELEAVDRFFRNPV
jgi:hypothetical protein